MLIDPKYVKFEKKDDVVDYISKGFLPPRKKYYDQLVAKIQNPDMDIVDNDPRRGKELLMPADVMTDEEMSILDKVYKNRKKNLIKGGIGLGIATLLLGFASYKKKKKNKKKIKDLEDQLDEYKYLLSPPEDDDDDLIDEFIEDAKNTDGVTVIEF